MISENHNDIVIYKNGEIELNVSIDDKTIWLRQNEISKLFEKDRTVITRHINNIFKDNEVSEKSNVQKMHFANSDKPVKLYSLDLGSRAFEEIGGEVVQGVAFVLEKAE